ncbi:hypothetical protein CPB83DRAFT_626824 [Crepidotus variabilis]|uniref:Uncharacterized protein n=1 Tax=Crepidotus variabilis TaxID=179855 RepID=A0A9P6EMP0_9AGAR|nr:hypothetical protein CPB83DRAFT_626824 [Crepidotus variabilis]
MHQHNTWPLTFAVGRLEQPLLEHLALSPRKFLRQLQVGDRRPSKSMQPCSAQFLISDPTPEEMITLGLREVLQFHSIELLPGGRFLVTSRLGHGIDPQNSGINVVQLWDLGIPTLGRQPRLLGTYVGQNRDQSSVDWSQDNLFYSRSEDDSHFLVVICRRRTFEDTGAVDSLIIVLRLRPFDVAPISTFLEEIFLGVRIRSCRLTGQNLSAAMSNGSVLLFALESTGTSLVAKWKSTAKKSPKIYHYGNRIFLLDSERIAQWSIPEMTTIDTPIIAHPGHPNHLPICTFTDLLPKPNRSIAHSEPLRMMSINTQAVMPLSIAWNLKCPPQTAPLRTSCPS